MTKSQRLESVFKNVFRQPGFILKSELTALNVPGWDSLKHIHLITAIEKEFGFRFTTSEILNLKNIGDIELIVEKKGS